MSEPIRVLVYDKATYVGAGLDACTSIFGVFRLMMSMKELYFANGKRCARLYNRVMMFKEVLEPFQSDASRIQSSKTALARLLEVCKAAQALLDEFCTLTKPMKAMRCFSHSQQFDEIFKDLEEARDDLGFCKSMGMGDTARKVEDQEDLRCDVEKLTADFEHGFENTDKRDTQEYEAYKFMRLKAGQELIGYQEIDYDDVTKDTSGYLGKGSFGCVTKCYYETNRYAMKEVFGGGELTAEDIAEFRDEVKIHQGLRFEGIVSLWGAITVIPNLCLLMELAPHGNLYNFLHVKKANITYNDKVAMMRDIASAIAYLHSRPIIHRDIKSANILVFDSLRLKVCDFGHSKVKSAIMRSQTRTYVGTVAYLPPEVHQGGSAKFDTAGDVYSTALVMYEMIMRQKPFWGCNEQDIRIAVCKGERPPVTPLIDPADAKLIACMEKCWHSNPSERMTSAQLRNQLHAFVLEDGGDRRDAFSVSKALTKIEILTARCDPPSTQTDAFHTSVASTEATPSAGSRPDSKSPVKPPLPPRSTNSPTFEVHNMKRAQAAPPSPPPPANAPASGDTVGSSWEHCEKIPPVYRSTDTRKSVSDTRKGPLDTMKSLSDTMQSLSETKKSPSTESASQASQAPQGSVSAGPSTTLRHLKYLRMHPAELRERWDFVLGVMQECPTDPLLQDAAFACFPLLTRDPSITEGLGCKGACELAASALDAFSTNRTVLSKVLESIACLSKIETNKARFAALDVGAKIMGAMGAGGANTLTAKMTRLVKKDSKEDNKDEASEYLVQQAGCLCLAVLSLHPEIRRQLVDCGGMQVVVKAMNKYLSVAAVQEYGSGAINSLLLPVDRTAETQRSSRIKMFSSNRNSISRGIGGQPEVCNVIVNAMKMHKTMLRVQKNCCKAIFSLCEKDSANQNEFAVKGVCEILAQALESEDVDVQALCIRAMYALINNNDGNVSKLSETKTLERLGVVIENHAANADMHECAENCIHLLQERRWVSKAVY